METTQTAARQQPDLDRLASLRPLHRIEGRNATKATVLFYRVDGKGIAVKSYEESPAVVRLTLGRWLIAAEAKAFRAAEGAPGLPGFLGRPHRCSIATEWIEGRTLAELRGSVVPPAVFDRLEEIVEGLHRRGVALWDLHHRDVLVSDDHSVHVVDLAMARTLGGSPNWIRRFLFQRASDADRVALARMRARYTGGDVDAAVADLGESVASWHRRGRRVKAAVDRLRGKRPEKGRSSGRADTRRGVEHE